MRSSSAASALTVSAAEHRPDLLLQSVAVDRILVEVDVSQDVHPPAPGIGEVPNGDIGVSATIRAAAWDALANVKLGMYVRIPALGPMLSQMAVWDTTAQAYVAFVTVASLDPDEHSAVHVEGVLSPTLRMDLARHVGEVLDADLLVYVDPTDDHPEFENGIISQLDEDGFDNGIFTTIALRISDVIPRVGGSVGQLDWEVPFDKSFSNGNVGVGLRFGANADVGSNGIHAEAMASVPVTLAGSTFDFCNLDAVGLYDPLHADDNGMVVTLKALNVKLYERRTKEDEALNPAPLTFQKEQTVSTTFMVGPVPMFVKLGARGTVGLELGASIGSAFALGAKPYLELDAFGEGGVGASYAGWTLGGGLAASLKLVDEKFHAGITAAVTYDSVTSLMTGTIAEVVANELEGPSGQVALFVEASGEILWKTITERWEHVLVQWNPFVKSDTLFNQNQSLSVLID